MGKNLANTKRGSKELQQQKASKKPSNQPLTVADWVNRLARHMNTLSEEEQEVVKGYWPAIRKGVELATEADVDLQELEMLAKREECFEYYLLMKATPYILENCPSEKHEVYWAKRQTQRRKLSWYNDLIRQRDNIRVAAGGHRLCRDEESRITDVGLSDRKWVPVADPPNPWKADPEEMLLALEDTRTLEKLLERVGTLAGTNARKYQWILEQWLAGTEPTPDDGPSLGVKADYVTILKHHAKKYAMRIMAEQDVGIAEKQAWAKSSSAEKRTIKKSTSKELKALYRYTRYAEEMKPGPVRHLRVIDGQKVLVSPDSGPAAGNVRPEMDEAA